jgi:hypothetical protein
MIRTPSLVTVALAAAVIASGCGGDDSASGESAAAASGPGAPAEPVGEKVAGSVAQFADCDDWNGGTREERLATIADIRGQHTPQQSESAASPLSDERAYEIFEKACAPDYAGSLRLYKLYVRAQGFAPLYD